MKLQIAHVVIATVFLIGAASIFWPRDESGLRRIGVVRALAGILLFALLYSAFSFDQTVDIEKQQQFGRVVNSVSDERDAALGRASDLDEQLQAKSKQLGEAEKRLEEEVAGRKDDQRKAARAVAEMEAALRASVAKDAEVKCEGDCEIVLRDQETVLFSSGKASLECEAKEKLASLVGYLTFRVQIGVKSIDIVGHTDNTGPPGREREYNKDLSMRRAQAVRAYLMDHHVPAKLITAIGSGMDQPWGTDEPQPDDVIAAKNMTATDRARNRRVGIRLIQDKTSVVTGG